MALRPIRLLLLGVLAGALAACATSVPTGGATTTPAASRGPAGATAPCPRAGDPELAGPATQDRPRLGEDGVSASFDHRSGRVVVVDVEGDTWTLDVCTNTWELGILLGPAQLFTPALFYDAVDDLTYAVDFRGGLPSVHTYAVETSVWTSVARPRGLWEWNGPEPRFVMDPTNRVIYGYQPSTGELRAYDIASNTWAEVQQAEPRPPTDVDALAAFDTTVGRIVLYVTPSGTHEPEPAMPTSQAYQTWTFDPRTGAWVHVPSTTPLLVFGYFPGGSEMTFDVESRRSVVFADGRVAAFDATAGEWSVPRPGVGWPAATSLSDLGYLVPGPDGAVAGVPLTAGPLARHGHGLVEDAVNGRVLVLGGRVRTPEREWRVATDVWAFDVGTNTWTELVPQQPS